MKSNKRKVVSVEQMDPADRARLQDEIDRADIRDDAVAHIVGDLQKDVLEYKIRRSEISDIIFSPEIRAIHRRTAPSGHHREDPTKTWVGQGRPPLWWAEYGVFDPTEVSP